MVELFTLKYLSLQMYIIAQKWKVYMDIPDLNQNVHLQKAENMLLRGHPKVASKVKPHIRGRYTKCMTRGEKIRVK